ncbi:hypothetical protein NPIL_108621, partial [Nephila pilipes]
TLSSYYDKEESVGLKYLQMIQVESSWFQSYTQELGFGHVHDRAQSWKDGSCRHTAVRLHKKLLIQSVLKGGGKL